MSRCTCCGCGFIFSSPTAFDSHRVGSHALRKRCCLDTEGLKKKGLVVNKKGVWAYPGGEDFVKRVKTSF